MGKLTALKAKNAGLGRHGDGKGLYLVVSEDGSRKWVLRIQSNGKRRDIGLGSASSVALVDARDAAEDMRRAVRRGEDPLTERRRWLRCFIVWGWSTASRTRCRKSSTWPNRKPSSRLMKLL